MVLIIIAFISLMGLIVLHEFGHFIMARRFGVKVEEFGVGLPPRIFGKKFGETIYSLNLIPFGAFVRLLGEEEEVLDPQSFSSKPVWQRALIVLAGVVSFWIISAILLSFVFWAGFPQAISDEENQNLVDPKVQIMSLAKNSPAQKAGLKAGDSIREFKVDNQQFKITKVKEIQELTAKYKGQEIILTIERGKEIFEVSLIPRIKPPEGEGALGVALTRTAIVSYPWYKAPFEGIIATGNLTVLVIQGWVQAIYNAINGLPTGVQMMGPVGIFSLLADISQLGIIYFIHFIAIISIYVALFNILPIPSLDGGKLLFLIIEKLRGKSLSQEIEQKITAFFFFLLIVLIAIITYHDIQRLF